MSNQRSFDEWKEVRMKTVETLRNLAYDIQEHEKNSRIAVLTGTSTSRKFPVISIQTNSCRLRVPMIYDTVEK